MQDLKIHFQIFVQCFLLCAVTVAAAIVYVTINYSSLPIWVNIFAQLTWQSAHGAAVIIYISLNRTLRKATFSTLLTTNLNTVLPFSGTSKKKKNIPKIKISVFK